MSETTPISEREATVRTDAAFKAFDYALMRMRLEVKEEMRMSATLGGAPKLAKYLTTLACVRLVNTLDVIELERRP